MTLRVPGARALLAAPAGVLLAVCAGPAPARAPRAERPPYKVGDTRLRADGIHGLVRVVKGRHVFSAGPEVRGPRVAGSRSAAAHADDGRDRGGAAHDTRGQRGP